VRVDRAAGERLVSVREGSYGTTAVVEDGHDRWITVNNSYVLGGAAATGEQKWQGHLPLLLHPAPKRAAFIGLGTAITMSPARVHPLETIVGLEIVPDVVRAAREDFADANDRILEDPRVSVAADDGRNYLAMPPMAFDVVVGDLLVPWRPAEAALYSREHFEAVRGALAPGGIFCQWLPLYQLSAPQLEIVLRTFTSVFPETTVWRGNFLPDAPTLALVGHTKAGPLDVTGIEERAATIAAAHAAANPFLAHPAGVWLHLVGPLPSRGAGAPGPGLINGDDEPWIELWSRESRTPIVGTPLLARLGPLVQAPLEGTPLASLDAAQRALRDKGWALAQASQERSAAGATRVVEILRTLPAALRRALAVDEGR
jgi:spermidine synthase